MSYLEELLPAFRKGVKIRRTGLLARLISQDEYRFEKGGYNGEPSIPYMNCRPVRKNAGTYRAIVVNTSDFVHPYCVTDDYQGAFLWGYTTETYIGKSKAKLSDLFEVQDD